MKYKIRCDERYLDYNIRPADSDTIEDAQFDIPEKIVTWIDQTIIEYQKVQDYLMKLCDDKELHICNVLTKEKMNEAIQKVYEEELVIMFEKKKQEEYEKNTLHSFAELRGKIITNIKKVDSKEYGDAIIFTLDSGDKYQLYHNQCCCERVTVEDVIGDFDDLLNSPILIAEEVTSETNPPDITKDYQDSFTWTFYKLATVKGHVTIRFYGESNGYYSESVDFDKVEID